MRRFGKGASGRVDGPGAGFYHDESEPVRPGRAGAFADAAATPDSVPFRARNRPVAVQMDLVRIVITESSVEQIIYLRETGGEKRTFPIVIGLFEASSIDRRVKGVVSERPQTHDLLANTIESLGGELQDIHISELRNHTYFAKLRVKQNGELVQIDCRPSDAIALAVTADVPIYVAEEVIDEAAR